MKALGPVEIGAVVVRLIAPASRRRSCDFIDERRQGGDSLLVIRQTGFGLGQTTGNFVTLFLGSPLPPGDLFAQQVQPV